MPRRRTAATHRRQPAITPDQMRALALAARHVNAPTPHLITEDVLLASIRSGEAPPQFASHLYAFIDETDTATLADLVISGAATYDQLAAIADRLLHETHGTRTWLRERLGS